MSTMLRRAGTLAAAFVALFDCAEGSGAGQSCAIGDDSQTCVASALQRRAAPASDHAMIQYRRSVAAVSSRTLVDSEVAMQIRGLLSSEGGIDVAADALAKGMSAVTDSIVYFTRSPPETAAGIQVLAIGLLVAIKRLLPDDVKGSSDFAEFETQWHTAFANLPSAVQSIEDDIMEFERSGDTALLVRSMSGFLLEAATTVTKMLPEQTGNVVARYIGSLTDVVDGIGNGLEAVEAGDVPVAVECIYHGVQSATNGLMPVSVLNDTTYQLVVSVLDATVGNFSAHVLAYRKHIMESSVCWRKYQQRPRRRPYVCDPGYTFDGEQWCIYRGVAPYTIQSRRSSRYVNIQWGSLKDGANVVVWNNPDSWHSQWAVRKADDGNYTFENVNSHTFLYAQGTKRGANVAATDFPEDSAKWRLVSLGVPAMYNVQSVVSGLYLNLEGSSTWSGTNVIVWDNPENPDSQWRIRSAWGGAPLEEVQDLKSAKPKPALLEASLQAKKPTGSLPSRCGEKDGYTEKRGAWCYGPCASGYVVTGDRCKSACGLAFPMNSEVMCGTSAAALAVAVSEMITETVRQTMTIAGLVQQMTDEGVTVAGGLVGTMQALIDAGKAFAHPLCPDASLDPPQVPFY